MFLSIRGEQFADIAGGSGVDHPGDSRSMAILDYDRDGWQDMAVINANTPMLQLYRNLIGDKSSQRDSQESAGRMVALRFVGGNHAARPHDSFSNRNGYGARVTVIVAGQKIVREHHAGAGLAAQNSATMIIGFGQHSRVDSIVIRWPSGVVQIMESVAAGTLVTAYEDPSQQSNGQAFVLQPYRVGSKSAAGVGRKLTKTDVRDERLRFPHLASNGTKEQLRLYTTMATWCAACKRELPQLQRLRALFDKEKVAIFGVPIDASEDHEKLKAYMARYQPAYELLLDFGKTEVESIQNHIKDTLRMDGLPATVVTDGEGYVLRTMWGVPSASEIHQLLAEVSL